LLFLSWRRHNRGNKKKKEKEEMSSTVSKGVKREGGRRVPLNQIFTILHEREKKERKSFSPTQD